MQRKLSGIIRVNFDATASDYIFCIRQILEKKCDYNKAVHHLFIDFKKPVIQLEGRSCITFSLSLVSP
jgi:hypothetical protein